MKTIRTCTVALLGIGIITATIQLLGQETPQPEGALTPAGPTPTGAQDRSQTGRGGQAAGRGGAAAAAPGRAGGGGGAYPSRPPADPQVVARGKELFSANCASCHAADLRGTERGINLVRSQMILDDQDGELIGPFLSSTHAAGAAPKMNWTPDQMKDIATYMHTFENYRNVILPPGSILVGNAQAGQTYFNAHCSSCHSVTGDLQGVATRYSTPKALQNALVSGSGGGRGFGAASSARATTVTITMASGQKLEGRLVRQDDFLVTYADAEGVEHTITRKGDVPKVEIHDPMKGHKDLLRVFTDDDIHNLTAYLETMK